MARPKIVGVSRVGHRLAASVAPAPTETRSTLQWFADGHRIAGATGRTLMLTPALRGKHLTARVTARRAGYRTATALPGATATVQAGVIHARAVHLHRAKHGL